MEELDEKIIKDNLKNFTQEEIDKIISVTNYCNNPNVIDICYVSKEKKHILLFGPYRE